ncbi:hypothetical protein SBOR_5626 [Sclerotinia borealis F-4128]|uniref:Uncharacterized protein n=1 Tax=Sclerotinia borealis (strain F-4128) TaxID=1432307 RepID=W9CHG9_SCLBF|nr:hypothetical protein SBOR_5626 [Sclerotinia borealis F-4128]
MPSKVLTSRFEKKSPKSKQSSPSTTFPPTPPQISSSEKPLPSPPKPSTGVLRRLLPRRRDSIALPGVLGSLNRGMERVRRHSLVAGGFVTISPILPITGTETVTNTNTITPPMLTSSEFEPEIAKAEGGEEYEDDDEDEDAEAEIGVAVEMTIVPVRARLIHIGCKGLDS